MVHEIKNTLYEKGDNMNKLKNNKITMTKEILNIINLILEYKRFICIQNYVIPKKNFNWYTETKQYYFKLPLPQELKRNTNHFKRILEYENSLDDRKINHGFFTKLDRLNNTDEKDLQFDIF